MAMHGISLRKGMGSWTLLAPASHQLICVRRDVIDAQDEGDAGRGPMR